MRKLAIAAVGCLCVQWGVVASAESVVTAVNHVLSTPKNRLRLARANVGIMVTSMRTGHAYLERNADHLFTPASVQKLFTATAALAYLKPDHHFDTAFYKTGRIAHGTLYGNLYLKFSGDPSLKTTNIDQMVESLKQRGIRRVDGHVYIDNTAFNPTPYPPGWIWDDLSYDYAAPMNAIILNRNKFGMSFYPSNIAGHKPNIETHLPPGVITIDNDMKTTKGYNGYCPITIYSNMRNNYRVGGCLDKRWGKQSRSLAMRDMPRYAQVLLADDFKDRDLHYVGSVSFHATPSNAEPIVDHESKPLRILLRHMLKKSDNLYTNAMFKTLGEYYYNGQGTWQNGLSALKKVLGPMTGIDFKHNLLADGAGLSRYNLITPHQLVKLLYAAYKRPRVHAALYAALPIAGVDGTLEARMPREGKGRRVHAKTGSMTGVSALAGYVKTHHHGTVGFAIMVNGFVGGRGPYIRLEDEICEAIAKT